MTKKDVQAVFEDEVVFGRFELPPRDALCSMCILYFYKQILFSLLITEIDLAGRFCPRYALILICLSSIQALQADSSKHSFIYRRMLREDPDSSFKIKDYIVINKNKHESFVGKQTRRQMI